MSSKMASKSKQKARIAFLHPDLGIGGAERLVVDAALALKNAGNSVTIFTSHHDPNHCFIETKNGQLDVITSGDGIPRSCLGRFRAFWAYLRMFWLTIFFIWRHKDEYDVVVSDLISAPLFLLKMSGQKCVFYCHHPDQLLTKRESLLKKVYRFFIDFLEEFGLRYADVILVNSKYTKSVFHNTFKTMNVNTRVLYPSVNFSAFDKKITGNLDIKLDNVETLFLSINRYERKKNLNLAIESLKELYDANNLNDAKSRKKIHLILVGGFDPLNVENLEHYQELTALARQLDIEENVTFLRSPSDEQKQHLLHSCTAVIYTPENEHFGIVPLEAMYMRRPVIAANSGGPMETVIDGETGFLCESNVVAFSQAMNKFVRDKSLSREMGIRGHERVTKKFNFQTFQSELSDVISGLLASE